MTTTTQARPVWRNWARIQRCTPALVRSPASTEELVEVVTQAARAGRSVKPVGSGHSFTDIACTTGVQVRLDHYNRVLGHDAQRGTVTVQSGITIAELGSELARRGLCMENLGDIAYQTISGAISTGTHGTGARLGGLATQVVGLDLVTGDGSVLRCTQEENGEVFSCGRVGLGALGILSTVTLACTPAFNLRAVEKPMKLPQVLSRLDELVDGNDHFEFFWIPHTDWCLTKANNRTEEPPTPGARWRELRERVLFENVAFGAVCFMGRLRPELIPRLATMAPGSGTTEYVERSDRVFTSPRWVRFSEMEYGVPRQAGPEVLERIRRLIDDQGLRISFPVEVRVTAADDIPLSTGQGRQSCYIAVHVYKGMPYEQYFRGVEAIMDSVGGRPHWGKLHYQTAATLAPRYAQWDRFQAVRRRLDPEGRFANAYTDRVLGPVGS